MWRIFRSNSVFRVQHYRESLSLSSSSSSSRWNTNNGGVITVAAAVILTYDSGDNSGQQQQKQQSSIRHSSSFNFCFTRNESAVQCEEQASSSTLKATKEERKKKLTQTFRQRKLSLKDGAGDNAVYSTTTEIDEKESDLQFINKNCSFSPKKVATYSCHGLEPHLIELEEENDENTNTTIGTSFISNLIGYTATPDNTITRNNATRRRCKITTTQKINQDRAHVINAYGKHDKTALFGVYDGHGKKGEHIAEYTMNALSEKLQAHPKYTTTTNDNEQIASALREIFCEIDKEVELQSYSKDSGSTACVALLRNSRLWIANVGDSRAVLAQKQNHVNTKDIHKDAVATTTNPKLCAINLTKDQTANDPQERIRIIDSGGYVTTPEDKTLPARVWLNRKCSMLGLAMSRSIGDHLLKKVGVIAEPVVETYEVKDGDEFLIIASDGVWEFVSSTEAVQIIQRCFDDGHGASEACKELIRVAMQKWKEKEGNYRDDITAIVVCLRDVWDT